MQSWLIKRPFTGPSANLQAQSGVVPREQFCWFWAMGHPDDSSDVSDSDSSTGDEDYRPFVSAFARCSKIKEAGVANLFSRNLDFFLSKTPSMSLKTMVSSFHVSTYIISIYLSTDLPIYLSIDLSNSLSLCLCLLSVSVCLCLSVSVCLCLSLSVSVSLCLSLSLSVCLCLSLSLSVCLCLSIYLSLSISLSFFLSTFFLLTYLPLSLSISVNRSISLSQNLFIYLSFYSPIYLTIYLSFFLFSFFFSLFLSLSVSLSLSFYLSVFVCVCVCVCVVCMNVCICVCTHVCTCFFEVYERKDIYIYKAHVLVLLHYPGAYHLTLDQAGMTLLVDHSGRIKKRPSIKDLVVNRDVACSHSHMNIFQGWVWDLTRFVKRMLTSIIPWWGPQSKVVLSVVEGSLGRVHQTPQLSAYTLQKAILVYYQDAKLFPEGICAAQPAVGDWALQNGVILKKLVWDSVATTDFAKWNNFCW